MQTRRAIFTLGLLLLIVASFAAMAGPPPGDELSDAEPYQVDEQRDAVVPGPGQAMARRVLLISIDGISHRTLQRFLPRLPNLRRVAKEGFVRKMETVFPSVTWSAHVSAATGQFPRVHGILGNRWYQSNRGLVRPYAGQTSDRDRMARAPSVYDLAHREGLITAALNWPGTQYATTLTYNLPETMYITDLPRRLTSRSLRPLIRRWQRARLRRGKARARAWGEEMGRVLRAEDVGSDRFVTDLALGLLSKSTAAIPRLLMVHYVAADHVQHAGGTRSPLLYPTLRRIDSMVGELLRAYKRRRLQRETATLIFSDHGFADVTQRMDLGRLFKQEGLSRYRSLRKSIVRGERVLAALNGHAAFIYLRDDDQKLRRHVVRVLKQQAYASCLQSVYTPPQLRRLGLPGPVAIEGEARRPERGEGLSTSTAGGHPGAPDLLALTRPHCAFGPNRSGKILHKVARRYGAHGYLPTHRAIQAFLIGAGAGVSSNGRKLSTCRIVDVAPTVARLLGLSWDEVKDGAGQRGAGRLAGRSLDEVLSPRRSASRDAPSPAWAAR